MPNWERTPPVSGLSVAEMKRRVKDGIARRRQTGELPPANLKVIQTIPDGPVLTKKHRRVLIQAANLAIYSLANNEREDYCGAAEAINAVFTELIIAPSYEDGVLDFLMERKNRRLIESLASASTDKAQDARSVVGGMLVQDVDATLDSAETVRADWTVATDRQPSDTEWADLDFAWRVCKHVKSNAIVYAKGGATLGIGAGQMSRIDSSELAVSKGAKSDLDFSGCVVASDAFYPFPDGLLAAAGAGATAAIQPGGSVRDDEVTAAANERGMAMVFTGKRHFRH